MTAEISLACAIATALALGRSPSMVPAEVQWVSGRAEARLAHATMAGACCADAVSAKSHVRRRPWALAVTRQDKYVYPLQGHRAQDFRVGRRAGCGEAGPGIPWGGADRWAPVRSRSVQSPQPL